MDFSFALASLACSPRSRARFARVLASLACPLGSRRRLTWPSRWDWIEPGSWEKTMKMIFNRMRMGTQTVRRRVCVCFQYRLFHVDSWEMHWGGGGDVNWGRGQKVRSGYPP
jgi:hypothetical protein